MQDKINHSLDIIEKAIDKYPNIAVACSFGKDSVVTVHLARQIDPNITIFSIMTPFKFDETFAYKDYLTSLWDLNIKTYMSESIRMWSFDPTENINMCCNHYKVDQTKKAIKELELDAWITGLRNTEGGDMRKFTKEIEEDKDPVKINPILHFDEKDIWMYHAKYNIPIHPLYLKGYRSLGCEPCSGKGGKDERSQRWNGKKTECGIHTQKLR